MTFEEAFKAYLIVSGTERSAAYQDTLMMRFFSRSFGKNTPVSDVTPRLLSRALGELRDRRITRGGAQVPLQPGTLNRHTQFLQRVLAHAEALGETIQTIKWKAFIAIEPEIQITPLTPEEELYVLRNIDAGVRPVFHFSMLTGIRLRNAIGLRWDMIDEAQGTITFRAKSRRPGGKIYVIPLTKGVRDILREHHGHHEDRVFTYIAKRNDRHGHHAGSRYPITDHVVRYYWDALDLDKRWHDVRHTFGTRLYGVSKDIHLVQRAMNHSDINTTMKYVHTDRKDIQDAMEKLSPQKCRCQKVGNSIYCAPQYLKESEVCQKGSFRDVNTGSGPNENKIPEEQKSNVVNFQQKQSGAVAGTRTRTPFSASTSTPRVVPKMEEKMQTPQGEELRIRQVAALWIVELKSPVHGRWIVIEDLTLYETAQERLRYWATHGWR